MVLGGGISLARMFLVSSGGIGQGMTDVIFSTFILDGFVLLSHLSFFFLAWTQPRHVI